MNNTTKEVTGSKTNLAEGISWKNNQDSNVLTKNNAFLASSLKWTFRLWKGGDFDECVYHTQVARLMGYDRFP